MPLEQVDAKLLLNSLRSFKNGDFSVRLPTDQHGYGGEIATAFNETIELAAGLSGELQRVGKVVGKEGKTLPRVRLSQGKGGWQASVVSVNTLIDDLIQPMTEIGNVALAITNGDLTQRMSLEVKGQPREGLYLSLAEIVNEMVKRLNLLLAEVTALGQAWAAGQFDRQANVQALAGKWRDVTDCLNMTGSEFSTQMSHVKALALAVSEGDLSHKLTVPAEGEFLALHLSLNQMMAQLNRFTNEVGHLTYKVNTKGQLRVQADVSGLAGKWRELLGQMNLMNADLAAQLREIAKVANAVREGNLGEQVTSAAHGDILEVHDTINRMANELNRFSLDVSTMLEALLRGNLGRQAYPWALSGRWHDITQSLNLISHNFSDQVRTMTEAVTAVASGKPTLPLESSRETTIEATTEMSRLNQKINLMMDTIRESRERRQEQNWCQTTLLRLIRLLHREREVEQVAELLLSEVAKTLSIQQAFFYTIDPNDEPMLKLISSYAQHEPLLRPLRLEKDVIRQSILEQKMIVVSQVPNDYLQLESGEVSNVPEYLYALPVLYQEQAEEGEAEVLAVMKLISCRPLSEIELSFLEELTDHLAILLANLRANKHTEALLRQSQALAVALEEHQSELEKTNAELDKQTQLLWERQFNLQQANTELEQQKQLLEAQQEQLEQANVELEQQKERLATQQRELEEAYAELEEQTDLLEQQNEQIEHKNEEVEKARRSLEKKAEQLALASKYKSEFLTNMSHELRTPLNSLLILSQILSENEAGNLTDKQIQYAQTIHASGTDLLTLINDILDLSKIEAGATTIEVDEVSLSDLYSNLERSFRQLARNKGLGFIIQVDNNWPDAIYTDSKRLQQILRNLLSNAFKFTAEGEVSLRMGIVRGGWSKEHDALNSADYVVAFCVRDTGIGIASEKQQLIFESFQQADGGISRQYGGTGLGLTISRELAQLLDGELRLAHSSPREGSSFVFYLPQSDEPPTISSSAAPSTSSIISNPQEESSQESDLAEFFGTSEVPDDRNNLQPNNPLLLIIEDDPAFAKILLSLARERGFKGLVATQGKLGLAMARQFKPDAITLDIRLPTMNGWAVLDHLKHEPETRHIPVHIISVEEQSLRGQKQGAIGVLQKPVSLAKLKQALEQLITFREQPKSLLVIEEEEEPRQQILEFLDDHDIQIIAVEHSSEALAALKEQPFDCIVLNHAIVQLEGVSLIQEISALCAAPLILLTEQALTVKEKELLSKIEQPVIPIDARSPEQLLDETSLFLHRVERNLPDAKRHLLKKSRLTDRDLIGKKVLVVDDDVRNLFAITNLLEQQQMKICHAENGKESLEVLQNNQDIDIILMDIMMPDMDGYEAMRHIRQDAQYDSLPIIALTAKAMKGDREKCLEAGASDYISKPLDNTQLLSLLRVWLYGA